MSFRSPLPMTRKFLRLPRPIRLGTPHRSATKDCLFAISWRVPSRGKRGAMFTVELGLRNSNPIDSALTVYRIQKQWSRNPGGLFIRVVVVAEEEPAGDRREHFGLFADRGAVAAAFSRHHPPGLDAGHGAFG